MAKTRANMPALGNRNASAIPNKARIQIGVNRTEGESADPVVGPDVEDGSTGLPTVTVFELLSYVMRPPNKDE